MAPSLAISPKPDSHARTIVFRPARNRGGLGCWVALPDTVDAQKPPLVAVHGIGRNAFEQAELFTQRAHALGRAVVAPFFSQADWPRYQQVIRPYRADHALIALMEDLSREAIRPTAHFELFGFSGGAQFAHRFAMMHPERVTRLTVASAGWYTFPDTARFPYGLSPRSDQAEPWPALREEHFVRFLTLPIQVCVGADDTRRDGALRTGHRIDAQQGANRLIRGIRWAQALREAAHKRGLPQRASFIALSGCDHSFRRCVLRAGLDRIVIPDDDTARGDIGKYGRMCRTGEQNTGMLRVVP